MAELNDLLVRGDSLLQGDAKINGKLNNHILNTDDNVLVIDVCRRLDVSVANNSIMIDIPDGYVCTCILGGNQNVLGFTTYGSIPTSWTTNCSLQVSSVRADTSAVETIDNDNIGNYGMGAINCNVPFFKGYLDIKVKTPCTGATKPYLTIYGQIICHKE